MSTNTKYGFSPLTTWFLPGLAVLIMTVGLWLLINLLWGSGDLGLIARFFGLESVDPRGSRGAYALAEGAIPKEARLVPTKDADPDEKRVSASADENVKPNPGRSATASAQAQTSTQTGATPAQEQDRRQAAADGAETDGEEIANNSYTGSESNAGGSDSKGGRDRPLFSNPEIAPTKILANPMDKHLPPPRKPVHAFNAELMIQSDNCLGITGKVSVPIWFRAETSAIKAASIDQLDSLVEIFNGCPNNGISISSHIDGKLDSAGNEALSVRREQEIKYYLLSRRVPIEALTIRNAS